MNRSYDAVSGVELPERDGSNWISNLAHLSSAPSTPLRYARGVGIGGGGGGLLSIC